MARNTWHILVLSLRSNQRRQGSLTVVAVIFATIIVSCIIFQCRSFQEQMSTIQEIRLINQKKLKNTVKTKRNIKLKGVDTTAQNTTLGRQLKK